MDRLGPFGYDVVADSGLERAIRELEHKDPRRQDYLMELCNLLTAGDMASMTAYMTGTLSERGVPFKSIAQMFLAAAELCYREGTGLPLEANTPFAPDDLRARVESMDGTDTNG